MVETRHQAALLALETQTTTTATTDQTQLLEWKQETVKDWIGKKIDTEAMMGQHTGVLGTSPTAPVVGSSTPTVVLPVENQKNLVRVLNEEEPKMSQGGVVNTHNNFAYKLLCPKFDGDDFRGWLSKLEQYFEAEMVPDYAKVQVVMLHLEGRALQWHQFVAKNQGGLNNMEWEEYLTMMKERFAPEGFDDPFAELVALRQVDSVDKYYEDFIHLLNQVQLPDDYVLSMFKNHLRIEISPMVKLLKPKSLIDAFHLAKHVEAMSWGNVFKGPGSSGIVSGPPSSKFSTPNVMSSHNTKQLNLGGQKGAGKLLTASEIEDRRRKGLCFWCASKYTPDHKCARTQLYQIVVEGVEEENEHEVFLDCEDTGELMVENSKKEGPTLSLNAMWGATNWETMKLNVTIDSSGCIALVKKLKLKMEKRDQLRVTVADGSWLTTLGKCRAVKWQVQGLMFVADFLVLPIKNCDMVLGIQWLSQLGTIKWNFAKYKMGFNVAGKEVELEGVQAGSLQWMSSKTCDKLLRGNNSPYTAAIWLLNPQLEVKGNDQQLATDMVRLLQEFKEVFEEPKGLPPERGHTHRIELKDENAVVKVKSYRHSAHQKDEIERLVGEMLESGIIRNNNSTFSSPIPPPVHLPYVTGDSLVAAVDRSLQHREAAIEMLKFHLKRAQDRSECELQVGDWVFLKLQPYRQQTVVYRSNNKLAPKWFGPFQIIDRVGKVAYKLKLPDNSKVHPVFHVSQLKKQIGSEPVQSELPVVDADGSISKEPMRILDRRMVKMGNMVVTEVLVEWSNSFPEDATWEIYHMLKQQFPQFDP
ncbi:hypothetical protein GQ457_04G005470 [Hibiscus cannabinus]